jgi:hypothetical protein
LTAAEKQVGSRSVDSESKARGRGYRTVPSMSC